MNMFSAILHRFRGPNEPMSELGIWWCMSVFIRMMLKPRLKKKQFATFYSQMLHDPGCIAIAIAANDLLAALCAYEDESAKFIALTHLEADRRLGLPVWGNPVPSNAVGALQECQAALMQFYIQVAALLERAITEAAAQDRVSQELHQGTAIFRPGSPSLILRKPSPPHAPPSAQDLP